MSSKKTLNAKNLEALGARRLAELLIDISTGDAAAKRRLRLELAGAQGVEEVASEVRKRLVSIGRSQSYVDWKRRKALIDDLESQRKAIVEKIAPQDPKEALDLAWRFMDLADSVHERSSDSSGSLSALFYSACVDLCAIAATAKPEPDQLADKTFAALMNNGYGQYDALLPRLREVLGPEGLGRMKTLAQAAADASAPEPAANRRVVAYGLMGAVYEDEFYHDLRQRTARRILQQVADAEGDVDAFIAQIDEQTRKVPKIAAEIATRLTEAGRADEALRVLGQAEDLQRGVGRIEWEDARIVALDALGRHDEAQAARWSAFETMLSAEHLREYLRRLPDFDDLEAEENALDLVERDYNPMAALSFLVKWPALDRAARMITARPEVLDGDLYHVLTPTAEALAAKHPLAATLALRAMINFSLERGRTSRYRYAARHLAECASLSAAIGSDFGAFEPHEAYVKRLRKQYGRKSSFWTFVE